jgi:hypothetical protein
MGEVVEALQGCWPVVGPSRRMARMMRVGAAVSKVSAQHLVSAPGAGPPAPDYWADSGTAQGSTLFGAVA